MHKRKSRNFTNNLIVNLNKIFVKFLKAFNYLSLEIFLDLK